MLRAAILLPGLLAACSPPDLGSCDVQCGTAGAICPHGSACASDGFCHSSTEEPLCRSGRDGGIGVDDDAAATEDAAVRSDAGESITLGYADPFLGQGAISANNLTGFAITVAETSELESFGLYMRTGSGGGGVRMALYNSLAGTGEPDALVATTTLFFDDAGEHVLAPTTEVTLAPGQYWLFAATAQLNDVGCDKTRTITGRYRAWTFGPTPPSSFGTASVWSTMHPVNYYLVLRGAI